MNPINDSAQLTALLSLLAAQVPILLVSLLGCIMMMGRWNEGSAGAGWALSGFGLSLALCVLIPVVQTIVQKWAIEGGHSIGQRASVFTALAVVWSVLRAGSYALLLMAVLAGRPAMRDV